jgi:hypothetical protein
MQLQLIYYFRQEQKRRRDEFESSLMKSLTTQEKDSVAATTGHQTPKRGSSSKSSQVSDYGVNDPTLADATFTDSSQPITLAVSAQNNFIDPSVNAVTRAVTASNLIVDRADDVNTSSVSTWASCEDLAFHPNDFQVKPIIGNKQIEVIEKFSFATGLPFHALQGEEIARLSQAELETHLTFVYKAISRAVTSISSLAQISSSSNSLTALHSISNYVGYLGCICASAEISNIVLNTSFLQLLLKIVQFNVGNYAINATRGERYSENNSTPSSSSISSQKLLSTLASSLTSIKITVITIIGTMLRYSTFVLPPLGKHKDDHILAVFMKLLSESITIKLKRRLVGALGEMLFYITAQDESPEKNADTEKWSIPPILDIIRPFIQDEDEVVRHYAVKVCQLSTKLLLCCLT